MRSSHNRSVIFCTLPFLYVLVGSNSALSSSGSELDTHISHSSERELSAGEAKKLKKRIEDVWSSKKTLTKGVVQIWKNEHYYTSKELEILTIRNEMTPGDRPEKTDFKEGDIEVEERKIYIQNECFRSESFTINSGVTPATKDVGVTLMFNGDSGMLHSPPQDDVDYSTANVLPSKEVEEFIDLQADFLQFHFYNSKHFLGKHKMLDPTLYSVGIKNRKLVLFRSEEIPGDELIHRTDLYLDPGKDYSVVFIRNYTLDGTVYFQLGIDYSFDKQNLIWYPYHFEYLTGIDKKGPSGIFNWNLTSSEIDIFIDKKMFQLTFPHNTFVTDFRPGIEGRERGRLLYLVKPTGKKEL